ncbi:MAG: purine-nucleoside phosphorylase [Alphaproteobacteria bacterium]|nr:purine-nucleoside phosphorylase [Alphaproteobacteria bacterium]
MINLNQLQNLMQNRKPETAIILGSGLGGIADNLQNKLIIKYEEIEGFPKSTVAGHNGQFVIGRIEDKEVLCMQGRFHLYEGHNPKVIAEVIQALKYIGIKELIVTNAAGSLNPDFHPGEIMLITDHINFSGCNPLLGANDDKIGPRFFDMSNAYDKDLQKKARNIAQKNNIKLNEGTYLMVLGPNFETAAEIRAFRILGADAVGMSTVPEVLAAVHCGIKILAISALTNFGTGIQTTPLSHEETLSGAAKASGCLTDLIINYIKEK